MKVAFTVVTSVASVAAIAILAMPTVASATDITKSYEFGPGTQFSRSAIRTFSLPCGTPGVITVIVRFRRLGPSDQSHSFSIQLEAHEPAAVGEEEGRIAHDGGNPVSTIVGTTERTLTWTVRPTDGGCSRPWLVRVKSRDGDAPYAVFGSVTLRYAGESRALSVPSFQNPYLKKGESKTILIEGAIGCGQGRMVITGTWNHTIGVVPGPLPVRLKFELLNDAFSTISRGSVVADASGYSNNEARSELTKLRLVHQVPDCRLGQWKLRITNVDDHDAFLNSPSVTMTPTCP